MTIIAVKNPGDEGALASTIATVPNADTESVIAEYGGQIETGALVVIADQDAEGEATNVYVYIADRTGNSVYLQNNEYLGQTDAPSIDDIGTVIESGYAPSAPPAPDPDDLETFTVFGNNDDCQNFVAVVAATEDTVVEVGKKAGLVDEGFEDSVDIVFVLKGDHSDAEVASI